MGGYAPLAKLFNRGRRKPPLLPRYERGQLAACVIGSAHETTESETPIRRKRFCVEIAAQPHTGVSKGGCAASALAERKGTGRQGANAPCPHEPRRGAAWAVGRKNRG